MAQAGLQTVLAREASILSERTNYLICTTPRTGSSLLCSLLGLVPVAGMNHGPRGTYEYLQELIRDDETDWGAIRLADLFRDYFDRGGVRAAGFKVMYGQLSIVAKGVAGSGLPDALARYLPPHTRFVWLSRGDKLKQAISLVRARQTNQWWAGGEVSGDPRFDPMAIEGSIRMIARHEAGWQRIFERADAQPIEVLYEDFVRDQSGVVGRVLAGLGLEAEGSIATIEGKTGHHKQSDGLNEEWERRYRAWQSEKGVKRRVLAARLRRAVKRLVR